MEEKIQNPQPVEEDSIDLVEILQKLWAKRKLILIITGAFMALGLFVALLTPNQYTASCTLVPQTGERRTGGSLGGLAAMAGISLGDISAGEVLSPNVYPNIIKNVEFQKELLHARYTFEGIAEPVTYYNYATDKKYRKFNLLGAIKKYTIGLPGVIIGAIRGEPEEEDAASGTVQDNIPRLTYAEQKVAKGLYEAFSLNLNQKEGYVQLSTTLRDPHLAAQITLKGQQLLQKYLTEFKLQKVRANLEFVENSYQEARANFEAKQEELARFRDANVNLTSAVARTREEKIQSEYTLLLGVYTEVAKQKEQAKIAVTETTPILTVIEPVIVPVEKSEPSRAKMLIIYTFLGLIVGMGWVLSTPMIKKIIYQIKKDNKNS
ncbi:MAG: Wzz/FepE/Etk N-terminal domain-containing protein [Bacteroidales bacterium]|nr:Wzz/FepE/Etk N-terminal domain-containing protein [Bacteroidales bacterium]